MDSLMMEARKLALKRAVHGLLDAVDSIKQGALELDNPRILRETAISLEVCEKRLQDYMGSAQGKLNAKAFGR